MRTLVFAAAALVSSFACTSSEPKIISAPEALTIDRSELSFGAIFVGGHFVDRVQVQNLGPTTVEVVAETIPQGFTVSPSVFRLDPQQVTTVEVAFRPTALGPVAGRIAFRPGTSRKNGTELRVSGEGIPRAVRVETSLDFGDVRIGEEQTLPLVITSETDAPLEVSLLHAGDIPVRFDREGFVLAPRGTETLQITFAPRVRSPASTSLILGLCSGCPTTEVSLVGNGLGVLLTASPSPLGFGGVAPGLR
ncbi:MAG TPA: choice-of-anchor D domain-containing protein, partial [Vulgatibacter sp.]